MKINLLIKYFNYIYILTFVYFCMVNRLVAIYRGKSEHHSTAQWLTAIN